MTRTNFEDAAVAARDVAELKDRFGMKDLHFWQLHHRINLEKNGDGIDAHLKYLATVRSLRSDQQQTARRFNVCLEERRARKPWPAAIEKARARVPGAQSFRR